ncbi:hypothetical protein PAXINDRAFT_156979 [Paxillus involutus ATCC 200175]|uniref:Uncharacterized protein n=1 Tax=Paxillus involutus ATCC 200175 TaxID=664439 RepID=A0A0C9TXP3_PAXIN|nr:hypothetical protein PAXINDRAFT_156979 [Paxillus involutus ATCC 200175]
MAPKSLSIWMQRAGRAGRSPLLQARAILLVQPTVFQEKNKTKKDPDKAGLTEYVKAVDEPLRTWIETKECRREIADEYFNSGVKRKCDCCNNCLARDTPPPHPTTPPNRPSSRASGAASSPSKTPRRNGKRPMLPGTAPDDEPKGPATRRNEKLKGAKSVLVQWRYETWQTYCSQAPYGPQGLMPDDILHRIASNARLVTPNDLKGTGWGPSRVVRHGIALLQVLREYDQQFDEARDVEKVERAEAKKRETAERRAAQQVAARADREQAKALKQSQPKPPRASRSKKPPVLAGSTTQNVDYPHAVLMTPQPERTTISNSSFENRPITPNPAYSMMSPHLPPSYMVPYPTPPSSTITPPSYAQMSLFGDPYNAAQPSLSTVISQPPARR